MKRLVLFLAVSASCSCMGQGLTLRSPLRDGAAAQVAGGLLIDENFEGTGTPSPWTTSGAAVDFDNTSSPIAGAQDLKSAVVGGAGAPLAASPEIWVQFEITMSALPQEGHAYTILLIGTAEYAIIRFQTSGDLGLYYHGGIGAGGSGTVDTMAASTHYWIFFHLKKGTGANGLCDVEFSTTSTRVGSGNKRLADTAGTLTTDILSFSVDRTSSGQWGTATFQIDNVKVSNTGWPP